MLIHPVCVVGIDSAAATCGCGLGFDDRGLGLDICGLVNITGQKFEMFSQR